MIIKELITKFELSILKGNKLLIFPALFCAFAFWIYATEAKTTYNDSFCNSDKCRARVERLKQCNWNTNCATKLTQEAGFKQLESELLNLKVLSLSSWLNEAVAFTAGFEWLRLVAYYDGYLNGSGRYSIGYGTKSYKGEVITKEEAVARKLKYIEPLYSSLPNCFNRNQKTALTSYLYNTWKYHSSILNKIDDCNIDGVERVMKTYWHNPELKPRRAKELIRYNL